MKKIIHIFIVIFSLFSLNTQAIDNLVQYNVECNHSNDKEMHEMEKTNTGHTEDCCDNNKNCDNCFECQLCTNYVKLFLNTNFSEYSIKNIDFYTYFYHIKESNPKNSIIPPIV